MKTGALHRSPERQLITPLPYSPPKMNAAFLRSGTTPTHRARSQYGWETSFRMSSTTWAAAARRDASLGVMSALALRTGTSRAAAADANLFIKHLKKGFRVSRGIVARLPPLHAVR